MRAGESVTGICVRRSFWADAGTPSGYLNAHRRSLQAYLANRPGRRLFEPEQLEKMRRLNRSGAIAGGFASVGRNVRISRNARIKNSVIWDGSVIGSRSSLENAIVCENTRVQGRINGMALPVEVTGDSQLVQAVRRLGWPTETTNALPLPRRGSDRIFTKIQHRDKRAVVVQYGPERAENALYVQNAKLLQTIGLRVPKILMHAPGMRLTVIEDAGDTSLMDRVRSKSPSALIGLYQRVLDSVAVLHRHGARNLCASITLSEPFSDNLYLCERKLFETHFLDRRFSKEKPVIKHAMQELEHVAAHLMREPDVLVHRDLQSENIMFCRGKPVFIDFQGMRFGPAVYDLASLLCDPYVSLTLSVQDRLLRYYAEAVNRPLKRLRDIFWWAAVERLIQAIGAYGKLSAVPETRQFGCHIRPALGMLCRALRYVDEMPFLSKIVDRSVQEDQVGR